MSIENVLILGAGNSQIDAIEYCKSKGYIVTGCSYTTVDGGIPYLDHFRQVDIKDAVGVAKLARECGAGLIYSIGSDVAMGTVMRVSRELGLPYFVSPRTADICHFKNQMREVLGRDFKGNVPYVVCSCLDEAKEFSHFPGMIKPVDSQGQRGCFKVNSLEDIEIRFSDSLEYSLIGKVIIESYIDGPEISVNAYRRNGMTEFAVVSDRISFDEYPGGIIKRHLIPSVNVSEKTQHAACDLTDRIAETIGINNGPIYSQIKVNSHGEPFIIEITPRLDGCHMWNLINHYCGVNLLDTCFSHLVNGTVDLKSHLPLKDVRYELAFLCQAPGTVFNSGNFDVERADYLFWYYRDGERVRKINGYMEKCGYLLRRI